MLSVDSYPESTIYCTIYFFKLVALNFVLSFYFTLKCLLKSGKFTIAPPQFQYLTNWYAKRFFLTKKVPSSHLAHRDEFKDSRGVPCRRYFEICRIKGTVMFSKSAIIIRYRYTPEHGQRESLLSASKNPT